MSLMDNASANALDEVFAQYAAGRLAPAQHALIAGHLVMAPRNRAFVKLLEGTLSSQLEGEANASTPDRAARLAAIFADPPRDTLQTARHPDEIPAPLRNLFGKSMAMTFEQLPWRSYLPGVRRVSVAGHETGGEANFYWIRAGKRLPSHTHDGLEMTLVLRGGFSDLTGHYARGDVAIADAQVDHRPLADPDTDCVCFAVTDAPLQLTGPIGRVMQRLFGHRH